ncbi:MAG: hypothetical protein JNG83_00315 [Opitutaceae bacterium]|nr:hypothetical protein [Opitutaceae bacterium]
MKKMLRLILSLLALGPAALLAAADFGFARTIDPRWFPDDARQWSGYERSVLVTDLGRAEPAAALVTGRREKGKWKVIPFATAGFSGRALSAYRATAPAPVSVALDRTGWHAVYVGLSTVSGGLHVAQKSGVRARLGRAEVYRRVGNNLALLEPRRDVIQEQFLTLADLRAGDTVEFAPIPDTAATIAYVRLVPVTEPERQAWERDLARTETRTTVATFDGHSWIWPHHPRRAAELEENFTGLEQTDFGQWWFGVLGADLVCYPSKIGTIAGEGTEDFPTEHHEAFAKSVQALVANGVNPLTVASRAARRQGREFHVFVRPQAWGASIPFEETFNSRFYLDHPEWRCVDREGRRTMLMSYAVPEVRRRVVDILREAVEMSGADGVGFFFNRGMPLMLWEKPFADQFRAEYGLEIMSVDAEDFRIYALRAKIMTGLLRDVRAMLDEVGRARGGRRLSISAATLTQERFNERYGLDAATWVREGLVDQLAPIVAFHAGDGVSKYAPPDIPYYRRITRGTPVRVLPVVVAWETKLWTAGPPEETCKLILRWYDEGAHGITLWDPEVAKAYGSNVHEGNAIDLLGYLGHRALIAHWSRHGVPLPNRFPLTRLDENEYSPWWPSIGY